MSSKKQRKKEAIPSITQADLKKQQDAHAVMMKQYKLNSHLATRPVPHYGSAGLTHFLLTLEALRDVRYTNEHLKELDDYQLYHGVMSGNITVIYNMPGMFDPKNGRAHPNTPFYVKDTTQLLRRDARIDPAVPEYQKKQIELYKGIRSQVDRRLIDVAREAGAVDIDGRININAYFQAIKEWAKREQDLQQAALSKVADNEQSDAQSMTADVEGQAIEFKEVASFGPDFDRAAQEDEATQTPGFTQVETRPELVQSATE